MSYVGYSRSTRSSIDIDNYEMPLSMINKDVITSFLSRYNDKDFNYYFSINDKEEINKIRKLSVAVWKFICKENGRSSWHHTSSYFNKTDHYSLDSALEYISENGLDNILKKYEEEKAKNKKSVDYKFGVIEVEVWEGSRNYKRIIGTEKQAGIVIKDWIYFKLGKDTISKYKTSANKVLSFKEYDTYDELVSENKEYKNTKRTFNFLIKEKAN